MKKPLLLTLFASLGLAAACEVPVFRFALERWPSDPLQVEVTADSSVGPEGESALKWLQNKVEGEASSNLMVKFLDPDGPSDSRGSIRLLPAGAPPGAPNVRPLWEGSLNEANARRLSGSPARAAIGKQLLEGVSAVWVVVSRGDKDADDKAMQTVSRGMNRAMQQLNLPSGVIRPEEAAQRLAANPQATMDDVLRTKLPLRIAFSVVLVRADETEEDLFREMVANLSPPEGDPGEPLIAPIFGRGRILSPAPASMIDEDRVYEACAYLCGACACMVKQQNPGMDLPFRINWDAHIEPHLASIDRPLGIPGPETVQYGTPPAAVVPATQPGPKILLWVALGIALLLPLGLWLGKRLRS